MWLNQGEQEQATSGESWHYTCTDTVRVLGGWKGESSMCSVHQGIKERLVKRASAVCVKEKKPASVIWEPESP